jgi:hypothetical protein
MNEMSYDRQREEMRMLSRRGIVGIDPATLKKKKKRDREAVPNLFSFSRFCIIQD